MLKSKNFYLSFFVLAAMVFFAVFSDKYTAVTLDGLKLWALSVAPSVFPYFVFTALLTSLGTAATLAAKTAPLTRRLFGCGGLAGYALFMSVLSGYPTGSKITAELYENKLITETEAKKMAGFCSTSGPLFIIGTIGGLLGDKTAAFYILLSHLLSVFLTGIIFRGKTPLKSPTNFNTKTADNIIYDAVYESVISLLVLGGIITVYYVITEMLFDAGLLNLPMKLLTPLLGTPEAAKALLTGIFECTKGIKLISNTGHPLAVPLIGLMISFGGLSVITQSLIFLKKAKIKTALFFFSKILQAVICFVILFIFSLTGLL